jgi:hypothetical protein
MAVANLPLPTSAGARFHQNLPLFIPNVFSSTSRHAAVGRVAHGVSPRGPCSSTVPVIATNFISREEFMVKIRVFSVCDWKYLDFFKKKFP